ncbi:unnamed protein product [Ambrosiozyma monospora]|uniref:Unnamed protein product n=1 Tax=Ambrosiozyma monospora TaxID=43982 RepID=A0ACB5SRX4_AMBMO|nr:unnamed protein product [Ambrosiozyma monospora]
MFGSFKMGEDGSISTTKVLKSYSSKRTEEQSDSKDKTAGKETSEKLPGDFSNYPISAPASLHESPENTDKTPEAHKDKNHDDEQMAVDTDEEVKDKESPAEFIHGVVKDADITIDDADMTDEDGGKDEIEKSVEPKGNEEVLKAIQPSPSDNASTAEPEVEDANSKESRNSRKSSIETIPELMVDEPNRLASTSANASDLIQSTTTPAPATTNTSTTNENGKAAHINFNGAIHFTSVTPGGKKTRTYKKKDSSVTAINDNDMDKCDPAVQAQLDSLLKSVTIENKALLYNLKQCNRESEFLKLCKTQSTQYDQREQILSLLDARDLLFNIDKKLSVEFTFEKFALLFPFFCELYHRDRATTGFKFITDTVALGCRYRETKHSVNQKRDVPDCKRKIKYFINYKTKTVQLQIQGGHRHDDMFRFPSLFVKQCVNFICRDHVHMKGEEIFVLLKRKLVGESVDDEVNKLLIQRLGVDAIPLNFIRSTKSKILEAIQLLGLEEPTVSYGFDTMEAAEYLHNHSDDVQFVEFQLPDSKDTGLLIADKTFFSELLYSTVMIVHATNFQVTRVLGTKLISGGYRDQFGEFQVGVTALVKIDNEDQTFDLVRFFFLAIKYLVSVIYPQSSTHRFFGTLSYVISEESMFIERAVEVVFNIEAKSNKRVLALISQPDKLESFRIKLAPFLNGMLYEMMKLALYATTREKCESLIHEAYALAVTNKLGTSVEEYLQLQFALRAKWATYFRQQRPLLLQINSSDPLIAIANKWKENYGIGDLEDSSVEMFEKLLNYFGNQHEDRENIEKKLSTKNFLHLSMIPQLSSFGPALQELLSGEFDIAHHFYLFRNHPEHHAEEIQEVKESSSGRICIINGSVPSCDFFQKWKLPCRHIFLRYLIRPNSIDQSCSKLGLLDSRLQRGYEMYDNFILYSDPLAPTPEQEKLFNVNIGFQQVIENLQRALNSSLYEKSSYDDATINEIYVKLKELTNIAERLLSTEMSDFSRSKTANLKVVDNLINQTIESARHRYGDNVSGRYLGSVSTRLQLNEKSEPILTNAVESMVAKRYVHHTTQTIRRKEKETRNNERKRQSAFERVQREMSKSGIPGYQVMRFENYNNPQPPSFQKSSGSLDGESDDAS